MAHLGIFALLAAIAALAQKQPWPAGTLLVQAVLVGIGLFVLPAVLTWFARKSVDDSTEVALFSLIPLFAVTLEPHFALTSQHRLAPRGGFLASIVAMAGTFLVFPIEMPHSYGTVFALFVLVIAAASVAAANCAGVEIVLRTKSVSTVAGVAAGSSSFMLALLAVALHQGDASAMPLNVWALPRLLALALLFWLMRRMGAVQMTTRFLIAPLLANLTSIAFLRPHLQVQAWIGLLLIAAGSAWLLLAPAEAREPTFNTLQMK